MTDAPTSSEATSSINIGAVIGGTTAGVITLVMLVTLLLGLLIYNKRRKEMKLSGLHERYVKFFVLTFYGISKSIQSNLSALEVFVPSNGICSSHPAKYSFILGNVIRNYNLLLYIDLVDVISHINLLPMIYPV